MKWFLALWSLLTIVFLSCTATASAQSATYRVFFVDKGPDVFAPGTDLYNRTLALFNERALERRRKVHSSDNLLTREDAPLYRVYLDSVARHAAILLHLRWANYAVVECTSEDSAAISRFSFVQKIQRTSSQVRTLSSASHTVAMSPLFAVQSTDDNCGEFRYGPSYEQVASINVQPLHRLGITGKGVLLGFLDSGFRWRNHTSTSHADVRAEYDFIFGDSLTANQEVDIPSQDDHGTLVFSTVAGFLQDRLIGTAPDASFLLGKTEDIRSEKHIEEDNYAAALEWMESEGVDIVTSSLGYFNFDSEQENYTYDQLDGKTTIVARAVNRAVDRGVICITAAGNEGFNVSTGTIISPGDADSVITVAAANLEHDGAARFSSRGPRGDGKRKPDIAAQGVRVYCAEATLPEVIKTSDGTSLATPLLAGGATLLLSLYPELTPWELRELLYSTASQANAPDSVLGYGLADIFKAAAARGIAIAPEIASYSSLYRSPDVCRVVAKMFTASPALSSTLYVRFAGEAGFTPFPMHAAAIDYTYYADVPLESFDGQPAEAYILADNGLQQRRLPFHTDSLLHIDARTTTIPCGVATSDLPFDFPGNIIEGIHPSVARKQVHSSVTLVLSTDRQADANISIFNILGQEMYSVVAPFVNIGMTNISLPITSLAPGTYFVQVLYGGMVWNHPFTVLE